MRDRWPLGPSFSLLLCLPARLLVCSPAPRSHRALFRLEHHSCRSTASGIQPNPNHPAYSLSFLLKSFKPPHHPKVPRRLGSFEPDLEFQPWAKNSTKLDRSQSLSDLLILLLTASAPNPAAHLFHNSFFSSNSPRIIQDGSSSAARSL